MADPLEQQGGEDNRSDAAKIGQFGVVMIAALLIEVGLTHLGVIVGNADRPWTLPLGIAIDVVALAWDAVVLVITVKIIWRLCRG